MILGKNQIKIVRMLLLSLIFLLLGIIFCKSFILREGVIFTNFDKKTFFTKPWDQFCIQTPASCQKDFLEKPGMIGNFPIGCNCESTGMSKTPPSIDRSCYNDNNYYFK